MGKEEKQNWPRIRTRSNPPLPDLPDHQLHTPLYQGFLLHSAVYRKQNHAAHRSSVLSFVPAPGLEGATEGLGNVCSSSTNSPLSKVSPSTDFVRYRNTNHSYQGTYLLSSGETSVNTKPRKARSCRGLEDRITHSR